MTSRPEYTAPPEIFYNAEEAHKYTSNTRMIQIQQQLTERCLELLSLPEGQPSYLLDIGCGSGLSGEQLGLAGHYWIGFDISGDMLDVAVDREVDGDLCLHDMGQGVPFKPGTFDGVVSVSALQWICNADKRSHDPRKRMKKFFTTLYSAMAHGGRAVFQFYPDSAAQMELVTQYALRAGFTGGIVIDYPNSTRAKKIFLCLFAGVAAAVPQGKTGEAAANAKGGAKFVRSDRAPERKSKKGDRTPVKSRAWILKKKERKRRQLGPDAVRPDTKNTGRRRPGAF